MRIFLDSADTDTIEKYWSTGLIDGITTNPTLIMKSGKNPEDVYQQLKDLGVPDISMEVMGDADEMISEGTRLYKKFGHCTTVKVPLTREGLTACRELSNLGINVNVTLIFCAAHKIISSSTATTSND